MQESRVYSFLDSENNYNIHFLEGQKIIFDLVHIHNLDSTALQYYRDTLLSSLNIVNFLKTGESIGIYIDSETPYFRFKIELSENGNFRTLLLPEQFNSFPEKLTGVCRITKIFPNKKPYTSVIQMHEEPATSIINVIFQQSYQTNSSVITAQESDQSIMITKLPPIKVDSTNHDQQMEPQEYYLSKKKLFNELFSMATSDTEKIVKFLENDSYAYLGSKQLKLTCSCSKQRMVTNLMNLGHNDADEIFRDSDKVEVRCDYCNTVYEIHRKDISSSQG